MNGKVEEEGELAGFKLLENPVILWTGGILVALLLIRFVLPSLLGGILDNLRKWFSDTVDSMFGFITDIFGAPASQDVNQRTAADSVRGLAVPGDRALSDLVDWVTGNGNTGGHLTASAQASQAAQATDNPDDSSG